MKYSLPYVTVLYDDQFDRYEDILHLSNYKNSSLTHLYAHKYSDNLNSDNLFNIVKLLLLNENEKIDVHNTDGVIVFISDDTLKIHHKKVLSRLKYMSSIIDKDKPLFVYFYGDSALFELSKALYATTPFRRIIRYNKNLLKNKVDANKILDFLHLLKISNESPKSMDNIAIIHLFETSSLPTNLWNDYMKLKIIYLSIKNKGFLETIKQNGWLCKNWKKYKKSISDTTPWNYSIIRFWATLLYTIDNHCVYNSFDELYNFNTYIHNDLLYKDYYGNEIFEQNARIIWVAPTKQKIIDIVKNM